MGAAEGSTNDSYLGLLSEIPKCLPAVWCIKSQVPYKFHQSMEKVTLPAGLQNLTFGGGFTQSMERVVLPVGCTVDVSWDEDWDEDEEEEEGAT